MTHTQQHNERLPIGALLALAMTGFICIVTETLPAGLLPQIGSGLGVSASLAGQMVTVYALGSLLTAIPLAIATQGWKRRTVLLTTIIGFLLFNSITALSSSYALIMVARFFAGVCAGLAWSLLAGYARRMVSVSLQGKARPWRLRWSVRPSRCPSGCPWVRGWALWSAGEWPSR